FSGRVIADVNGPVPSVVHVTAIPATIAIAVAAPRGPNRSAPQTSGGAIMYVCQNRRLSLTPGEAKISTAIATTEINAAPASNHLRAERWTGPPFAQARMRDATTITPMASPSHHEPHNLVKPPGATSPPSVSETVPIVALNSVLTPAASTTSAITSVTRS